MGFSFAHSYLFPVDENTLTGPGGACIIYVPQGDFAFLEGENLAGDAIKNRFSGKFIVLDGPDGCGKSTQVKMLAERLEGDGVECKILRDPGTTVIGEKIRQVLLDVEHSAMTTETEVLLYMAARVQLWYEQIATALEQEKCVLLDRWLSSTCAYQGYAGGFGMDRVIQIAKDCLPKPWPDLTVILDVDLETAAKRLKRDLDRMESKGDNYHQKVREGFLQLPEKIEKALVVDATQSVDDIHKNVIQAVEQIANN